MEHRDISSRTGWFTLCVVLGVMALGIIPPFKIYGMLTQRVDILSELRSEVASVDETEYIADMERLEQELAMMAVDRVALVDTLPEPPTTRYEWIMEQASKREYRALRSDDFRIDTFIF